MRAHEFIIEAPSKAIDQEKLARVKQLWDEGWKHKDIAELLGMVPNTVSHWLKDYYPDRPRQQTFLALALTDADKADIVSKWQNGQSVVDISNEYGVKHMTVARIIINAVGKEQYDNRIKANQGKAGYNKMTTPDQIEQMASMYRSGMSSPAIGNKFNVTASTVLHHLKKRSDWSELEAEYKNNHVRKSSGPALTDKTRSGEIGNLRSKGPRSRHTSGVSWPKYGE